MPVAQPLQHFLALPEEVEVRALPSRLDQRSAPS
jgi:hypothetical protein